MDTSNDNTKVTSSKVDFEVDSMTRSDLWKIRDNSGTKIAEPGSNTDSNTDTDKILRKKDQDLEYVTTTSEVKLLGGTRESGRRLSYAEIHIVGSQNDFSEERIGNIAAVKAVASKNQVYPNITNVDDDLLASVRWHHINKTSGSDADINDKFVTVSGLGEVLNTDTTMDTSTEGAKIGYKEIPENVEGDIESTEMLVTSFKGEDFYTYRVPYVMMKSNHESEAKLPGKKLFSLGDLPVGRLQNEREMPSEMLPKSGMLPNQELLPKSEERTSCELHISHSHEMITNLDDLPSDDEVLDMMPQEWLPGGGTFFAYASSLDSSSLEVLPNAGKTISDFFPLEKLPEAGKLNSNFSSVFEQHFVETEKFVTLKEIINSHSVANQAFSLEKLPPYESQSAERLPLDDTVSEDSSDSESLPLSKDIELRTQLVEPTYVHHREVRNSLLLESWETVLNMKKEVPNKNTQDTFVSNKTVTLEQPVDKTDQAKTARLPTDQVVTSYTIKKSSSTPVFYTSISLDSSDLEPGHFIRQTSVRGRRSAKSKLKAVRLTSVEENRTKEAKPTRYVKNRQRSATTTVMGSARLGSLSKDHGGNKPERREEKENTVLPQAPDIQGQLMQRCVIIQKDEKGYGLTVSGDNPVFVQSVKENGAASRAGVQKGDRIIKVNGTLVTNSNHVEVVNLIKSGSYVALTLLGRTPAKVTPGGDGLNPPINERVSAPQSVNAEMDQEYKTQKIATIRMMYERAANEYEKMKAELVRNPQVGHLQAQLNDVGKTLRTLEQQLFELTGIPAESQQLSPRPILSPIGYPPPHPPGPPPPHPGGHLRRYGSGDHLHHIRDSGEMESVPETLQYNPAPWICVDESMDTPDTQDFTSYLENTAVRNDDIDALAKKKSYLMLSGGPKHRKADSMPESFYVSDEGLHTARDVTVTRSHSDSRKRTSQAVLSVADMKEGVSAEEIEKLRTASLPTSMSEAGTTSDHSPHLSPATSPSPEAVSSLDDSHSEPLPFGTETPSSARTVIALNLVTPENRLPLQVVSPHQVDVISMEDDEFTSEDEHLDEHGPFGDLNVLKHKPAHLTIFLHYLISNSDPSPLLFYLVTENYNTGNMKEMRRWAYEIHSTFLINSAPLRVNVDDNIVASIDNILQHKFEKEDALRSVFQLARHIAQSEISELLADFRNKRALGLGSLYGDHELQDDNMSKTMELQIVEKYLVPHFERLVKEEGSDRNQAMASALATFLKQVGVQLSSKNAPLLEKCYSFTSKDKKIFRFGSKNKQKGLAVKNHSFCPQHYYTVTNCFHCQNTIWGLGSQGYQCINCDYNVHKQCMDLVKDTCLGRKATSRHRKSMLEKIITRKVSSNNPQAIPPYVTAVREAQKNVEEKEKEAGITSPGSGTPGSVFHISRDDDEDLAEEENPSSPATKKRSDSLTPFSQIQEFFQGGETAKSQISRRSGIRYKAGSGKSTFYPIIEGEREERPDLSRDNSGEVTPPPDYSPVMERRIVDNNPLLYNTKGFENGYMSSSLKDLSESFTDSNRKSGQDYYSDLMRSPDDNRSSNATNRSRSPDTVTDTDDPKKPTTNLTRSESLNKRPESRKNVRRTKSDLHVDEHTLKALNQSGSSSNSSISGSFESPTNSHEILSNESSLSRSSIRDDDSDFDTETELPRLEDTIPSETLKRLKPKEKKRQDVINELFYTERTHVRNLKVMYRVFYIPMLQTDWVPHDLVKLLFPNLSDMIELHGSLNSGFKAKRKEAAVIGDIADILLERFSGEAGERFKGACAIFCRNQSFALDQLRNRMRKEAKLAAYLQDLSLNPLCRRLELKDLIPSGMQRLTKYPLLIENLMKYTPTNSDEYERLQKAWEESKSILNFVNQAVKDQEDHLKLVELQKRLDRRPIENVSHPVVMEYKNLDLTRHRMIHDGALTWRIGQKKLIDLHVILLEDILVLLQKQDEKLVLKCQSTTVVAGKEDTKFTHSPIIKLTNLLTRNVATDRRAFFLVSTSELGPQIYELVASTVDDKNKWFKYISEATDAYKGKDSGKLRRPGTSTRPPPSPSTHMRPDDDDSHDTPSRKESREESQSVMRDTIEEEGEQHDPRLERNRSASIDSLEQMKVVEVQQINHAELIQPNEVVVMDTPFEHAQPVLTPMEKLKRRDEMVREALEDKQRIVSQILHVPEGEFEHIADMVGEVEGEKEAKELVLAAISQANKLAELLNTALTLSEDSITPNADSVAAGPSWDSEQRALNVQVPSHKVSSIASHLNKNLRELLGVVTSRDEEKERLQHQLRLAQEQLSMLRDAPPRSPSTSQASRPNSFASIASSTASDNADDLTDGQSTQQIGSLTQQNLAVEVEQFTTVSSGSSQSSGEDKGPHEKAPGPSDPNMVSSISSESQDGEEGFHDAQTDAQMDDNISNSKSEESDKTISDF